MSIAYLKPGKYVQGKQEQQRSEGKSIHQQALEGCTICRWWHDLIQYLVEIVSHRSCHHKTAMNHITVLRGIVNIILI